MSKIDVYDGFVEVIDTFGNELDIVNAARVSFAGESVEWSKKDENLLRYLWTNDHTSPFRMVTMKFRVKAPIFVLRQWMKHVIGCNWNEVSGRYVEFVDDTSVYRPSSWRGQHPTSKQASLGILDEEISLECDSRLEESYRTSFKNYRWMLSQGVARELARIQLPVGLYSEVIWKADLQAVLHFLKLRLDEHAQEEIREYAQSIKELVSQAFPHVIELFEIDTKVSKQLHDEKIEKIKTYYQEKN